MFGNVLSGLTITHLDTDRSIEAAWVLSSEPDSRESRIQSIALNLRADDP